MGCEFGKLSRVWHVISGSLSPTLRAAGLPAPLRQGHPPVLRHIQVTVLSAAPPFVLFYLVYTWGTQEFKRSKRKNPAVYENDE
ncbi:cytochrome b-c1 complex subunit 8-like [Sturnira hondurensis]|uniref:cytochrome b-c1 complex subunit 8-like n=1 Tax=Sturnira hondurensis TaxID=192404 RepID=UPI00187936A3|nr:cytochrome b-c1 complex subunit 8-like [Sturnira hondurensis]